MVKKYILGFIVLTVVAAVSFFIFFSISKEKVFTITLTENGFEPKSLNITKGDTVKFVSETGRQFWPASDSHPSHGVFPDFDPKKPINPEKSWEFTFEKLGSWNYHDHLASQFNGIITVYSKFGQSTSECLDRDSKTLQEKCWIDEFKLTHTESGFTGVFTLFKEYQANDSLFANNCHDVMHVLGDFAYEEYAKLGEVFDQPETSYCAFGFYHGFIERMIEETGDYDSSRKYCEQLRTEGDFISEQIAADAEGACVHGFGHAIFDSLDGSLWGDEEAMVDTGLRVCEEVFEGDFYESECGTGIWNALANAHVAQRYNLGFIEDVLPFSICLRTKDLYKPGCYVEMMTQFTHWNEDTNERSFEIIRNNVEPIAQGKVYYSYISDAIQWRLPYDYKTIAQYADRCPLDSFEWCQLGIHYGVLKLTSPYINKEESQKVCNEYVDVSKRSICEKTIMNKL